MNFIPALVWAYERCWIFGDYFGSRSFEQYFQARKSVEYNGYVKAHYDTTGFFGNDFMCDNPSMLARMSNLLINAMECKFNGKLLPLPKIITVVPDDDFIKILNLPDGEDSDIGVTKPINRLLNFVMTEFERNVASFKEFLPAKCVHHNFPQFLWIQAPLHQNFRNNNLRHKFNKSLEEVCKLYANTISLMLKKVWDPQNLNLYNGDTQCFSVQGYTDYWEAVDRTIRYFDLVVLKKQFQPNLKKRATVSC